MPGATSPVAVQGISLLDEEEDDDSEPIGALASIQAAAMKGTRPR